jgi:hypothetical protein
VTVGKESRPASASIVVVVGAGSGSCKRWGPTEFRAGGYIHSVFAESFEIIECKRAVENLLFAS